ncbi:hypothetical protein PAAG_12037 [Paracoccidioides lutzii Pb01]|uniref:Uncharacterized protein n=1 Tax=Paracoccidioides lutzii (strain ATCC MYA-826 / Pb01) TaxID=502779 RepID=A0A0A2V0F0_PARBA|nr:hypothetical protein PAAG_12037 [Paracoccidioides lutzii Pb01]KGQ01266.1 hypothetical protein PAAG_12037 [Paracoccidioides lutzii Pb01]
MRLEFTPSQSSKNPRISTCNTKVQSDGDLVAKRYAGLLSQSDSASTIFFPYSPTSFHLIKHIKSRVSNANNESKGSGIPRFFHMQSAMARSQSESHPSLKDVKLTRSVQLSSQTHRSPSVQGVENAQLCLAVGPNR